MRRPEPLLSRRTTMQLIASSAAALTMTAIGSRTHAFAAPATTGHHAFKHGAFDILVVSDGSFALPLNFVLPETPKPDAEALYAAHGQKLDANGSITGQMNITVVKTPDATLVIDCGGGSDFMPSMGQFADNLERAGITPDSVTHVVFTHAHADHLWGVIDPLDGGTRFPKARHVISAAEFDYWMKPGVETLVPEAMKGVAIGSARRLGILAERLDKQKPGAEIAPGVVLLDTAGHTPGHVSVLLKSGSEQLLIGGDVLTNPVVSFAKPEWPWGPDDDRDRATAARRRTLDMLAADKIALLGYHLPWPGLGRVERKDTAFRLVM